MKIMSESYFGTSQKSAQLSTSTDYGTLAALKIIFSRLDTQANVITYAQMWHRQTFSLPDERLDHDADIPLSFSSLKQARLSLENIRSAAIHVIQSLNPASENRDKNIFTVHLTCSSSLLKLRQWSSAFDSFLQSKANHADRGTQEGIHIMKLHRILMGLNFGMNLMRLDKDECAWDDYTSQFDAKAISDLSISTVPSNGRRKAELCLDIGIVLPLYFVAVKCRQGSTRWKAIEILMKTERQEGVWNSILTGRVAKRLVQIEEEGLCGVIVAKDVLKEKRVEGVEVRFDMEDRRAFLKYRRLTQYESGVPKGPVVVEEWVEW
jgi:hypothetical protein